jgi:hypothetical protein
MMMMMMMMMMMIIIIIIIIIIIKLMWNEKSAVVPVTVGTIGTNSKTRRKCRLHCTRRRHHVLFHTQFFGIKYRMQMKNQPVYILVCRS